jgi:hypothetical protein
MPANLICLPGAGPCTSAAVTLVRPVGLAAARLPNSGAVISLKPQMRPNPTKSNQIRPNPTAAAREGGCARGCKSHPSNWTVHDGTARCLSPRKAARGVSSPGIEPMGLNEDEPHQMSLDKVNNRRRRAPGWRVKADADSVDNRQSLSSPAGSAWQARREGQPQIKRGERSR